ncbi:tsr1232 [Thermosynechococcus vestitus BP-1]|uniref:Tsr1232 protein n=1 Tax=Thermosynechococcus vestitus (strain NIES-2133 / IAM M-273 / BP-1) TaxID=197221 RepID=Q8DJJ1_THEVB|nr:tsr1232 [Thermosynechococcus vestitus BP-1]
MGIDPSGQLRYGLRFGQFKEHVWHCTQNYIDIWVGQWYRGSFGGIFSGTIAP